MKPLRSCLYLPGSNARAIDKARSLPVDAIIFDLEDAVAPQSKLQARQLVLQALEDGGFGGRQTVVRINGLDTPWGAGDLDAFAAKKVDAFLLPKVVEPAQVEAVEGVLSAAGASDECNIWAMIEMPLSIVNLHRIAETVANTRLAALVMGTNDLAKELRLTEDSDRSGLQFALSATVVACRAFGLAAIDGVFNDFKNPAGLRAECMQGLAFGFDGKTLIHPTQLEIANEVFAPSSEASSASPVCGTAASAPSSSDAPASGSMNSSSAAWAISIWVWEALGCDSAKAGAANKLRRTPHQRNE